MNVSLPHTPICMSRIIHEFAWQRSAHTAVRNQTTPTLMHLLLLLCQGGYCGLGMGVADVQVKVGGRVRPSPNSG